MALNKNMNPSDNDLFSGVDVDKDPIYLLVIYSNSAFYSIDSLKQYSQTYRQGFRNISFYLKLPVEEQSDFLGSFRTSLRFCLFSSSKVSSDSAVNELPSRCLKNVTARSVRFEDVTMIRREVLECYLFVIVNMVVVAA